MTEAARSDAGALAAEEPVRVLYVVGAGRSGSTVLNTVLGSHPAVEGVGELTNLVEHGWIQELFCACGERAPACPFWSRVGREWSDRLGGEDVLQYLPLQQRFERVRSLLPAAVARHDGVGFREYERRTVALFRAIRAASGAPVVVDSSKGPVRGLALARMRGLDLRVVHLVRDGRGVANSLRRAYARDVRQGIQRDMPGRPVWRTALFWVLANRLADRVRAAVGPERSLLLRYEDFVADPAAALDAIGRLVEVDVSGVARALAAGEAFSTGHTIAGNRLRMAGSVTLRPDERWRGELPARQRRLVSVLTALDLRRYGYPLRTGASGGG